MFHDNCRNPDISFYRTATYVKHTLFWTDVKAVVPMVGALERQTQENHVLPVSAFPLLTSWRGGESVIGKGGGNLC